METTVQKPKYNESNLSNRQTLKWEKYKSNRTTLDRVDAYGTQFNYALYRVVDEDGKEYFILKVHRTIENYVYRIDEILNFESEVMAKRYAESIEEGIIVIKFSSLSNFGKI